MATKYIEAVGAAAGEAATALSGALKTDAAGNVYPVVFDAFDGIMKYYDRKNSAVRQQALLNQPVVSLVAATTITEALHAGRTMVLNLVGGFTATLPLATGSGNKYRFVVGIAGNAYIINATGSTFVGGYIQNDNGGSAAVTADFIQVTAGDNTYSPTTAGGGGAIGDWVEFQDILATVYVMTGLNQGVIDPTTRFSTV